MQTQKVIIIERDVDEDRFISYENFKKLLKEFPVLSKEQIYFMMLGITGWRPNELCRAKIDDLDLSDSENPRIKWKLSKPKQFFKNGYLVKRYKIKWRLIPGWAGQILQAYIKKHIFEMVDGYLFPSREKWKGDEHMDVRTMQTTLQRKRDELIKKDPEKWAWVKEPYQIIVYPNGRKQAYYKVSLYSFRKMHATYFARMLLDHGIADVLLATAQHMGHTKPETTMKYVKAILDEKPLVNSGFKKAVDYAFDFAFSMPRADKCQTKLSVFSRKN